MSLAPRTVTPERRVNGYTVLVSKGAGDGITEGDRLLLEVDGEETIGTVVDTDMENAVVELHRER